MIIEEVLPFLTDITCQDVDIIMAVVGRTRWYLKFAYTTIVEKAHIQFFNEMCFSSPVRLL